ncbi:MAG: exbD 5 [Firmicutes bacterium]|nr:exbD 5 [Bacillota bacterium]
MKLDKLRIKKTPRLMIIPMIDIIFFLLVFFMMSTLYMVDQRVIPVILPSAAAAQADRSTMVPITVTAQGKILIDQTEFPDELVTSRIKAEVSKNPDTAFILRADKKVEYGRVIWLLDELKKCGVRRVAAATEVIP